MTSAKTTKKDDILCAAIDVFLEHGYEPATMESIAAGAQVSKRTLYKYFPTKETLFEAIIEVLLDQANNPENIIYSPDLDLKPQLTSYCSALLETYRCECYIKLARIVLGQCITSREKAEHLLNKLGDSEPVLSSWIKAAHKDGKLEVSDIDIATNHLMGSIKSFSLWPQLFMWQAPPSDEECQKNIEIAVNNFLLLYSAK